MKLIRTRQQTLEGQAIVRALPLLSARSVGPFVFFDHMLWQPYSAGQGVEIAQHPHIGLCTLTYLLEGHLQHKDSLGSDQLVAPGDVSLMTAGRGVAHVERTPATLKGTSHALHGLQVWLALPTELEDCMPSYQHYQAGNLPTSESLGVHIRVIAGAGFCLESPVNTYCPTLYAHLTLEAGSTLILPDEHEERAIYVIEGKALIEDQTLETHVLVTLSSGSTPLLRAYERCQIVFFGGAAIARKQIDWNFVSSSPDKIKTAKQRWSNGDWPTVPGETTRIELPR